MLFFGFCRQNRFAFGSDVLSWELSIFYHPFSLSFLSDLSDNLSWMELFNQEFTQLPYLSSLLSPPRRLKSATFQQLHQSTDLSLFWLHELVNQTVFDFFHFSSFFPCKGIVRQGWFCRRWRGLPYKLKMRMRIHLREGLTREFLQLSMGIKYLS